MANGHLPSPQPHPRPVEFARNFSLRAAGFVHTPSARSANIRSVMPANPRLHGASEGLFHTVAGARPAGFTASVMVPAGQVAAPLPPQNLDAEESVLGAMLLSEAAIEAASDALAAGDFYPESHARRDP